MKAFNAALESLGLRRFEIRKLPPDPEYVNKYFNDSTESGEFNEDATGHWNTGGD